MKKFLYISLLLALLTVLSCSREPVAPPEPVIEYISIAQLREMYESGITEVDSLVYIQGVITLTPELGNVPDMVAYIQDTSAAICLTVSDDNNTLAMNSEVKILCDGVSFEEYNGLLQFGADYSLSISSNIEVISLTASIEPEVVTIDQLLAGEYEGCYVELDGVQFDASGTFSGSKTLTDCSSEIAVYTRSVATFSSNTMPTGNGVLKGVASIYNNAQILLRDPSELDMTGERCGAAAVTYLTQDFTSLASGASVSTLTGWESVSEAGSQAWKGYIYSSDHFARITAYGSGETSVISWMITPAVDLSSAVSPYVSFTSADGYDNGATLTLLVSDDYDGSGNPASFTWTTLTFTLPASNTTYYSDFASSGKVDLSAFAGSTVRIAWKYTGADLSGTASDNTTTWEVDNILVAQD